MDTFSNTSYQCYFDNAATTKVRDEVADIIVDVLKNNYGRIVNIASIAGKEGNPNASA